MSKNSLRRITGLLLILSMLLGFVTMGFSVPAMAQGDGSGNLQALYSKEQLESFELIDRSARPAGLIGFTGEYALEGEDGESKGMVSVIVEFVHQPPLLQQAEAALKGKSALPLKEAVNLAEGDHADFKAEMNSLFGVNNSRAASPYEITATYTDALNGVALTLPADRAAEVAELDTVWAVYPNAAVYADEAVVEPNGDQSGMAGSRSYLNIDALHDQGITGEGVTVGVLDTGVDYNHPDLKDAFGTDIKAGSDMRPIGGKYYGRNFVSYTGLSRSAYDPMETTYAEWTGLTPAQSEYHPLYGTSFYTFHGTHVSGTVAGRGVNEPSSALGMAPGAALLVYRVLGPYGTGESEWILSALDCVYRDGCDVVNMSLGASINDPSYVTSLAVNNLIVAHDIAFSVSAGNLGPNPSSLGSPGTSSLAITVANGTLPSSVVEMTLPAYRWGPAVSMSLIIGNNDVSLAENGDGTISITAPWLEDTGGQYELVCLENIDTESYGCAYFSGWSADWINYYDFTLGQGSRAEFEKFKDKIPGNVVVVNRGLNFVDTAALAKEYGAAAVVVLAYQEGMDPSGVDRPNPAYMQASGSQYAPLFFMSNKTVNTGIMNVPEGWTAISVRLDPGTGWVRYPAVTFNGLKESVTAAAVYSGESASSRGPVGTTTDIKPDIMAPGENILSTAPYFVTAPDKTDPSADGAYDGAYATLSGTSMSAPHIAGIAALMRGYSNENKLGWTAAEIKARMMNTADPLEGAFSVYEMGSGYVNPAAAISAGAYVTVAYNDVYLPSAGDPYSMSSERGEGEVASFNFRSLQAGQEEDQSVTLDATVHNAGAAGKTFALTYTRNCGGFTASGQGDLIATGAMWSASGVGLTFSEELVRVDADGSADFTATATVPAGADDTGFYEGYVVLTNVSDPDETYRLPFSISLRTESPMELLFLNHPSITTAGLYIDPDYGLMGDFTNMHTVDSCYSSLYYSLGESAYTMYLIVAPGDITDVYDESQWLGELGYGLNLWYSEPGTVYREFRAIEPVYVKYTNEEHTEGEWAIYEPGHYTIIAYTITPYGVSLYPIDLYVDNELPELTVDGLEGDTLVYSGPSRSEIVITGNICDAGLAYMRENNIQYQIYEPTDPHGPDADQALNAVFARIADSGGEYVQADIRPDGGFELVLKGLDISGTTQIDLYYMDHFAIADFEWISNIELDYEFNPDTPCMVKTFGYPFAFYGTNIDHKSITIRHTGPAMTMDKQYTSTITGKTVALKPTLNAEARGAGYGQSFEWVSSDERVATVNGNGVVTAVDWGTATITAKSKNPEGGLIYASCEVYVSGLNDGVAIEDWAYVFYGTYEYAKFPVRHDKNNPWIEKSEEPFALLGADPAGQYQVYYTELPILWEYNGEETRSGVGDRMMTLYSAYALDTMDYSDNGWVPYEDSKVNEYINGEFIERAFTEAERAAIPEFTVTNGTYDKDGNLIAEYEIEGQRAYLPWGIAANSNSMYSNYVFWTAGNEPQFDFSQKGASSWRNHRRMRDTGTVQWATYYLRNPAEEQGNVMISKGSEGDVKSTDDWSYYGTGLNWYDEYQNYGESEVGVAVAPITKLDMGSVLYAQEYYDNTWRFFKIDQAPGYRLTVLGGNNGADVGTLGGITDEARTILRGQSLSFSGVTSSVYGSDYRIAYKITGYDGDGKREIKSHSEISTGSDPRSLNLSTSSLAIGNYMVYVWLEKKDEISSYEAGTVVSFPLSVVETMPEPALEVSVSTPTIVSTLSAYLNITVTDAPQGADLKAYLEVGGELLYETPVTNGAGRMYIPKAPDVAADTVYRLVVKGGGREGECDIKVVFYDTGIWVATAFEGAGGYLNIKFNAPISSKTNFAKSVTIGGTAYNAAVENGNTLAVRDAAYESLEPGEKIVISGVKYQELFPSYSFTFTIYR